MSRRIGVALHAGQLAQRAPGGIGRYVRGLIDHLPEAGIDVTAFGGELPGRMVPLRYELWHRARRPAVRAAGDLVHAPSLAVPPPGRRPLVVTIHDLEFLRLPDASTRRGVRFHRRGLAIARAEAAAVITASEHVAGQLAAESFDAARVHVVPYGIEPPPPAPATDPGIPAPFILAVGTIEPRKGFDTLARAFGAARASHPDLSLVIAGPPGWGTVAGLDAPGIVRLGPIDDARLDALYRAATVLAFPSRSEGFGLPPVEAMARGCAVVASNAGAIPEVVGDAALLVPPGDVDALAAALTDVVDDDSTRARLVAAGSARAARYTWEACARGHRRAYEASLDST